MSDLILKTQSIPLPPVPITIRPGLLSDVPFMDSLQKLHTKQVGWMPTKQFEGKIALGHVLVAEASRQCSVTSGQRDASHLTTDHSPLTTIPVGYCVGNDQYFKRDDVGIIYQMNVSPVRQRGLIGASLLKAQFERSAYGCRLYCCWCAQDIAANRFWEAMGFVPLAFRAGSEKRSRVHLFWQKRIRQGDASTPWWFPAKTDGGAIRADRIVLPIPPGTHWSDAMPIVLPNEQGQTPSPRVGKPASAPASRKPEIVTRKFRPSVRFGPPPMTDDLPAPKPAKPERVKQPKVKTDPKLVSAARELRDRWLEQVNDNPAAIQGHGKYDVSRTLSEATPTPLLAA